MNKYLDWAFLILGLWILASPWLLGFSYIDTARWGNITVGLLIVIVALWRLFGEKQSRP